MRNLTSLNYNDIFSYFLGNITDYKLADMAEYDASELMVEYLHKVLANPKVAKLFSSITFNDDTETIEYELSNQTELINEEFIKLVLSKGMVCEWLRPKVRSTVNTALLIGGKETKWFSQANHLSELRALLHDTEIELSKLITSRGYVESALSEA